MKTNYREKACSGCQWFIHTRKGAYGRTACGHNLMVLGLPVDWNKVGQDREVFANGSCDDWQKKTIPDVPESPFSSSSW